MNSFRKIKNIILGLSNKEKIIIYEFIVFIFLVILYYFPLSGHYAYRGFVRDHFESLKFMISLAFISILILLGAKVKNSVYYFVYHTHLVMVMMSGMILYSFAGTSLMPNIYYSIPLFSFFILDHFSIESKTKNKYQHFSLFRQRPFAMSSRTIWVVIIITLIMMIPFFLNLRGVNLSNLLFMDVYETRLSFRTTGSIIIGYLMSPLSRFVLPFIAVYALKNKKHLLLLLSIILTLIVYLTSGALKGLIFSFALVVFFALYESISSKILLFLRLFTAGLFVEIGYYFITSEEFLTGYLRRALFVAPQLFDQYYTYFKDNYIYYRHSRIISLITGDSSYRGITHWFGENVIGRENLNASVGTFVEGYISLGIWGVLIASLLFVLFCAFYSSVELDYAYIGLLYSATHLFRGAFLETLVITHGLLLFALMIVFLIPRKNPRLSAQRIE